MLKSCKKKHPSLITSVNVWATAPFGERRAQVVLTPRAKICQSSLLGLLSSFTSNMSQQCSVRIHHVETKRHVGRKMQMENLGGFWQIEKIQMCNAN